MSTTQLQQQIADLENRRAKLQSRHAQLAGEIQRQLDDRANALRAADVATATLPEAPSAKLQAARDDQGVVARLIRELDSEIAPLQRALADAQRAAAQAASDRERERKDHALVAARDVMREHLRAFILQHANDLTALEAAEQAAGHRIERAVTGSEGHLIRDFEHVARSVLPNHPNLFAPIK